VLTFTKPQLILVRKSLVLAEKSASRLAVKEEQPDSVATEYRRHAVDIAQLIKVIDVEIIEVEKKAK
jgi:hypothetical protein